MPAQGEGEGEPERKRERDRERGYTRELRPPPVSPSTSAPGLRTRPHTAGYARDASTECCCTTRGREHDRATAPRTAGTHPPTDTEFTEAAGRGEDRSIG